MLPRLDPPATTSRVHQNYKPALPMPCPICKSGTVNPCTEERDPDVVGCCNNPDCDFRMEGRDWLTGLRSRPFVDQELPRILGTAVDEGTNLEVALLDIDHLNLVVGNYMHLVGDQVLVQQRLSGDRSAPLGDITVAAEVSSESDTAQVVGIDRLGGLIHEYVRAA